MQSTEEARHPTVNWLKRAQHDDFFDLGDDLPSVDEVLGGEEIPETNSLPEPEQIPSSASESGPRVPEEEGDTQEVPSSSVDGEPDPLTTPIPEARPGELSEEDAMFGDVFEGYFGRSDKCWEVDITPEKNLEKYWDLEESPQSNEEIAFIASEMRKKRVEVKLKELGEHEQRLFAAAKHRDWSLAASQNGQKGVQGQDP